MIIPYLYLHGYYVHHKVGKITRKKILIASVLKPVNDPRMFGKFALTLAEDPTYHIYLLGFVSSYMNVYANIHFKPLFRFSRLGISRIFAPLRFFFQTLKIYPDMIIIQTHELIWAAVLYKKLTKCKLVYDIQENYYFNHRYGKPYHIFLKHLTALYIRIKEKITWKWMDHIIFAERCYPTEMPFITDNYTIIENKFVKPEYTPSLTSDSKEKSKRLIFTGTISRDTGIFHAIELARKLHHRDENFYLVICGYCPDRAIRKKIKYIAKRKRYVKLIWDSIPLNYVEIIREIEKSSFGIIAYEPQLPYKNRIPGKMYEYIAMNLPIICWKNPTWDSYIQKFQAGVSIDFLSYDAHALLEQLKAPFYQNEMPKDEVYWSVEAKKLMEVTKKLL